MTPQHHTTYRHRWIALAVPGARLADWQTLGAMSDPYDVLVVCEGNLCRSPLTERLLRLRVSDAPHVRVTSAGTRAVVGSAMDASAAAELVRLGGDPEGFVARQLTPGLVTAADLVLTATRAQRSQVVGLAPAALKRTFTLLELAALLDTRPWAEGGDRVEDADLRQVVMRAADWRASVSGLGDDLDIPDPIGRSREVHEASADLADKATAVVAGLLRRAAP
jgi:protein-tyrosine phosphatase